MRYLKAFTSPWKIRFQELVDEIDGAFNYINDVTQARSYLTAETNLVISSQILQVDNKMWNVIQRLPEQIQKLEDKLKTVHFEKNIDIYQTTSMVQQRLEERVSDPSTLLISGGAKEIGNEGVFSLIDFTAIYKVKRSSQVNRVTYMSRRCKYSPSRGVFFHNSCYFASLV